MDVLHPRCAGLDVHSRHVTACVRVAVGRTVTTEHRELATTTAGLLDLSAWLTEAGCTQVAMEATGVYWKPVWQLVRVDDLLLQFGEQSVALLHQRLGVGRLLGGFGCHPPRLDAMDDGLVLLVGHQFPPRAHARSAQSRPRGAHLIRTSRCVRSLIA